MKFTGRCCHTSISTCIPTIISPFKIRCRSAPPSRDTLTYITCSKNPPPRPYQQQSPYGSNSGDDNTNNNALPPWKRYYHQKKLSRQAEATLESIYLRTQWPNDQVIEGVWQLHKMPRQKVIDWFKERRLQGDGPPLDKKKKKEKKVENSDPEQWWGSQDNGNNNNNIEETEEEEGEEEER